MGTERDICGEPGATLHAVSSAVLAVTRHLSVHEVLQVIVRAAARLLDARYAALGVPDDEGSFAEFVVEGVTDAEWNAIGPLPRQHGMLAVMLNEGAPQRLADIRREPEFGGWPSAHPVLKDFLGVPIRDGEDVLGIIFLANRRRPGGFTEGDEELLTLFAAHAAIAITNARLYERDRELTVVEERNRLARELHDAVSQKLFSLRLTAQAAAALAEKDPARTVAELAQVQRLAGEALAELRAVILELRPADLAGDGLVATLRKHVEVLDRAYDAEVDLTVEQEAAAVAAALPDEHETVVFRVAQEAIHNALRHAGAEAVRVRLDGGDGGGLVLEVADDGAGFDPAVADRRPARAGRAGRAGSTGREGLGLTSMRERAESVGGALTIDSRPAKGAGTRVRLEVPGA
ncbi:GAF domain-containing sensor histidine kinase [Thermomonospora umbrina]|uniref:Oxygen sensor histidine kinase NreB n=1 Tax=Thermomonospora umbrina TaxID=111806 RepID=A0A3D9SX09_9ACTN|nr:GAF domain-containing sensor histidine kinase [Thermomonospora umbrina]REE97535.1 histidine kinase/DNA gyrase B/HSP90-like ATPase [Thermomonospora umbrina]